MQPLLLAVMALVASEPPPARPLPPSIGSLGLGSGIHFGYESELDSDANVPLILQAAYDSIGSAWFHLRGSLWWPLTDGYLAIGAEAAAGFFLIDDADACGPSYWHTMWRAETWMHHRWRYLGPTCDGVNLLVLGGVRGFFFTCDYHDEHASAPDPIVAPTAELLVVFRVGASATVIQIGGQAAFDLFGSGAGAFFRMALDLAPLHVGLDLGGFFERGFTLTADLGLAFW